MIRAAAGILSTYLKIRPGLGKLRGSLRHMKVGGRRGEGRGGSFSWGQEASRGRSGASPENGVPKLELGNEEKIWQVQGFQAILAAIKKVMNLGNLWHIYAKISRGASKTCGTITILFIQRFHHKEYILRLLWRGLSSRLDNLPRGSSLQLEMLPGMI
jgi:hypothetical protein